MNDHKKGRKRLLNDILADRIGRLVVTHKDRLLRFGAELVFAISEAKQVEVVILNQGEDTTFEEKLAQDVLEIISGSMGVGRGRTKNCWKASNGRSRRYRRDYCS